MYKLVDWFAANPIAANMLMLVILFGGLSSLGSINKEVQPTYKENIILVTLPYPGASPQDIEQQICIRIDEALDNLQGVKKITCTARQDSALARIEGLDNYAINKLLDDVKSNINAISNFPNDSERPIIQQLITAIPVLSIAVIGGNDERSLKEFAHQIKTELVQLPAIPKVTLQGTRDYEISIEIDERTLRRYNLSINDIALAIRRDSINLGGGIIRTAHGEVQIQSTNQAYTDVDFAQIPVISGTDGSELSIGDIATIKYDFEEMQQITRINGERAVILTIDAGESPNVLVTADAAKNFIDQRHKTLPADFKLRIWRDSSRYFNDRLHTLATNGISGLLLVFIVLMLFLRTALVAWVTVGIGIAFTGSLLMLPILGVSINMLTLFAYIMVLGIVVDDAIIVGESIYTQQQRGMNGIKAAQAGVQQVLQPVFFAVLTSIIVFIPLLLLSGKWAYFLAPIATIPILVLIFSLLESCLILPAHLAHLTPPKKIQTNVWGRFKKHFEYYFRYIILRYRKFLQHCLIQRWLTLTAFLVFLALTLSLLIGGWVNISLLPNVALDTIVIEETFTEDAPFADIDQSVLKLEKSARQTADDLRKDGESSMIHNLFAHAENNHVTVIVELTPEDQHQASIADFSHRWQHYIGTHRQSEKFKIIDKIAFDEADLQWRIYGADLATLQVASDWLQDRLQKIAGMHSINDNLVPGRPKLQVTPKPIASHWGVYFDDIARQLRHTFYGEEAQRVPLGREDVRIMVRSSKTERQDINHLLHELYIRNNQGVQIPFDTVANVEFVSSYAEIERINSQISVEVEADYDGDTPLQQVLDDNLPNLLTDFSRQFPTVKLETAGGQQEVQKFANDLERLGFLAVLVIYALLSIQFRSLWQPLLVVSAIPFGMAGAIWAHLLIGQNISLMSILGMLAAAGVVVNDSLVLINAINRNQRHGFNLIHTLAFSTRNRFRAIFLTSLTTFVGLMPIMTETSTQAKFLIPMATSLAFGVVTATVVTLILTPCLYLLGQDIKQYFRTLKI